MLPKPHIVLSTFSYPNTARVIDHCGLANIFLCANASGIFSLARIDYQLLTIKNMMSS